ncbi:MULTISPECIES: tail fiber domain-containing protein [unclassified Pseudomonas]|uniref:tail fiber domain-containing protein n=1 Tax=unclassified Pseudomonas TaxID=196821 RepID=UPI001B344BF1|nr:MULTISPECIES: tail fiber domain-containing protein [unclassified Pseudomonas]MBP5948554.1 tail fiber domain-containing protein [Pseudomonas sp. P9(2020)]MBZ9560718.1 tail fiber domain-containing protein [Pseudomonas sp. P116]
MSWYKTGTVSVTQNTNAVIGTGTAFIANSRVGDGFRGPDGRWYEVTNIASNTALSISPNYEGPTVAGGFYSIMPVQGYPKDLSDQVRNWVNTYGPKMAALGTTGNYDILPVIKGGTGSNTLNTDVVPEGATNKYFAGSRVLASLLDGLSTASAAVIVAGDNVLSALGKLQAQITGRALKGNNNDITGLLATAYVRTSGTTNVAQGQGLYQLWNTGAGGLVGSGDWVCNQGGGTGGFSWRSVNLNNTLTGPTMTYTYAGNLNVPGTVSQGSDRRLKTNDVEILDGLDRILQIRPVEFDRRDFLDSTEYPHHEVGVIAQELYEITPLLVTPAKPDVEEDIWRVNYTGLIPYLVSAIKTLKAEIEELKSTPQ